VKKDSKSLAVPVTCGGPRYSKMGGCDMVESYKWSKG